MLSFYFASLCLSLVFATSPPAIGVPGGIFEIDESNEVRTAASFAADEINVESRIPEVTGQKWFTLTKINSPTSQVVSGYNYRMEIVLKQSDCLNIDRNLGASIQDCPPIAGGITRKCRVKVWHQSWGHGYSLESSDCTVN